MHETGKLPELPIVPTVKASQGGRPVKKPNRVAAPEVTPQEARSILARLPERSGKGKWPVKARFIVMYETTLRPESLHRLSVPENYSPGSDVITLTDSDDKELYGRQIPLTDKARRALDRVCPEKGPIFGRHRYTGYLRRAAEQVLPAHKARTWAGQHFRSASITHWLERPKGRLPAVQYLAGHKHTSTTSRYVRPTFRAAKKMVGGR